MAAFTLTFATSFGYAAGWNPYAANATRYFAPETGEKAIALWSGLGVFVSCTILEIAGAMSFLALGIRIQLGLGVAVSVWLFSKQVQYTGPLASRPGPPGWRERA